MERLTNCNHGGTRSVRLDEESVLKMWSKLAVYEDAEGNGTLIRLPCKVGDPVYWISLFGTGICQGNVVAIKISAFGFDLEISTQGSPLAIKRELEKVFLSEPEAWKVLEGMK